MSGREKERYGLENHKAGKNIRGHPPLNERLAILVVLAHVS